MTMNEVDFLKKHPYVIKILTSRGKKNKYNRSSATDVIARCPCCTKERVTTNWALGLHNRACKSPSGWCKTCSMTLYHHPDWIEILPKLWQKHGVWTNRIIGRFNSTIHRSR